VTLEFATSIVYKIVYVYSITQKTYTNIVIDVIGSISTQSK